MRASVQHVYPAPMSLVEPIPQPNLDAILRWFQALDATDFRNACLGAFTVAFLGLLLVLGAMALNRLRRA